MTPPMTNVDPSQVGQVIQDFIDFDHVSQLRVDKETDGTYTVTPLS
jgi:hypothetical protein